MKKERKRGEEMNTEQKERGWGGGKEKRLKRGMKERVEERGKLVGKRLERSEREREREDEEIKMRLKRV